MKWIKKHLVKRGNVENPTVPISSSDIWDIFGQNQSDSGAAVNRTTVLGSSAVWRAINLISSSIARLPLITYKRKNEGGSERDSKHPAYFLLKKRPSQYCSSYSFVQVLTAHALLHGNGYAAIVRDAFANPIELLILDPTQTYPARENGELLYVTKAGQNDIKLLPENVLHIKGLGFDGLSGYSVIDVLRDTFGHDIAVQKFGNVFFKNGSAINVVVELPGYFKDKEAIERFRNSWGAMHEGLDRAHRLAILENGAKASRLTYTNEEAQYLQSKEFNLKALANIFGLPASYLNASYNTSYGSLEAEGKQFLNHSLGGWLCSWEQELESKLLTTEQVANDTHFIEFERKAFERADKKTEIEVINLQLSSGLLTLDEARELMNLPLLPKPEAKPEPIQPVAAPQAEDVQKEEDVSRKLTRGILERLTARLAKDVDGKWHDDFLQRHLPTFQKELSAVNNGFALRWLTDFEQELINVLPEQRKAIVENTDLDKLNGELWKLKTNKS